MTEFLCKYKTFYFIIPDVGTFSLRMLALFHSGYWQGHLQTKTLAEDIEGLDLQDVTHHWTAHSPAIAGGSILDVVITDIEFSDAERLGLQSSD